MHPFDGWNTMEGRHLVFAYAAVILIQGGYFAWTAWGFNRVVRQEQSLRNEAGSKKAAKPV